VISKTLIFVFLPYYITNCNALIINNNKTTIGTIGHKRKEKKRRKEEKKERTQ